MTMDECKAHTSETWPELREAHRPRPAPEMEAEQWQEYCDASSTFPSSAQDICPERHARPAAV